MRTSPQARAANGTLTYTLAADANGLATVSVTLKDNGGTANGGVDTSAPQYFTISVTAVNDAPSFTKGADQTKLEDAGPQTVAGWATGISAGPANESSQAVSFNITGNTNAALFSAGPAVAPMYQMSDPLIGMSENELRQKLGVALDPAANALGNFYWLMSDGTLCAHDKDLISPTPCPALAGALQNPSSLALRTVYPSTTVTHVYWTETPTPGACTGQGSVHRLAVDTSGDAGPAAIDAGSTVLIDGVSCPQVAVDWMTGDVYYSNGGDIHHRHGP